MEDGDLIFQVTTLVMQLAIIIFLGWSITQLTNKLKIPTVIGLILLGIILSPFLLGSISLPYFKQGLFSLHTGNIPVSPILYSFATLASILLLFMSGLETDMALFIRYVVKGSIVGIGGLVLSFLGGYLVSVFANPTEGLLTPSHLFMGAIGTATSVGISTAVLSSKNKINSPEGITILSAAVIDDVLGIITLAVVLGITNVLQTNAVIDSKLVLQLLLVGAKAIVIWLFCTVLGIIFSRKIGRSIKNVFKEATVITIIALGMAFLLGGMFQILGLSMVIGAYIIGLVFSNTDLSYVIKEKMQPIAYWIIPIFFIVTGMIINAKEFFNPQTLIIGLIYAFVCILGKLVGSGIAARFLGFNFLGSLRIGIGLVPRGEVSLIIASLGVSMGLISSEYLGAILIMIVLSDIIAPFFLDKLLSINKSGTTSEHQEKEIITEFNFYNNNLTRLILLDFLQLLGEENFYINELSKDNIKIYHLRRDNVFITLNCIDNSLIFYTDETSISFIKTALYEATGNIAESSSRIKATLDPKTVMTSETSSISSIDLKQFIDPALVSLQIQANSKQEIITELSEMLDQLGILSNKDQFIEDVLEREKTFSTGMQQGIALPHAKSEAVIQTKVVIALKPEGVDFDSLDKKPSQIFILIASKPDASHLSLITQISTLLNLKDFREKLLASTKIIDVIQLFSTYNVKSHYKDIVKDNAKDTTKDSSKKIAK